MLQALRDPLRVFTDFAVAPVSYTVFADGARYYAKNGDTGAIEFADMDAVKVIQYAINRASALGGGVVFVRRGLYTLSDQIVMRDNVVLVGEGYNTILMLGVNVLKNVVYMYRISNAGIARLKVNGNRQNNPFQGTWNWQDAIRIDQCNNIFVSDVFVEEATASGIHIDQSYNVFVRNVIIKNVDGTGIHVGVVTGLGENIVIDGADIKETGLDTTSPRLFREFFGFTAINGVVRNVRGKNTVNTGINGFYVGTYSRNVLVENVKVEGVRRVPVVDSYTRNIVFRNIEVIANPPSGDSAVVVGGTDNQQVTLKDVRVVNQGAGFGIHVIGTNKHVYLKRCRVEMPPGSTAPSIRVVASATYVFIENCYMNTHITITENSAYVFVRRNVIESRTSISIGVWNTNMHVIEDNYVNQPITLTTGAIAKIRRNIGYATESSGVATISAGSTRVTVSHGLVKAPTKVFITPLAQPLGKLWVENITSTSFDIVTDVVPATDLRVAWYVEV
jgi:hypothetical protein